MDRRKMYQDALTILERGKSAFQSQLAEVDKAVEGIRKESEQHPIIDMLEPGRSHLQDDIDTLNREIERMQKLADGLPLDAGDEGVKLRPGQYKGVRKLATAVQAYLLHYPGYGPIRVAELTEILNKAGVRIQVRNGKDKGQRKPVEAKHIRIMAADYKTGFSSKSLTSPFILDRVRDTIQLKVPEEAEKARTKVGPSGKERLGENVARRNSEVVE